VHVRRGDYVGNPQFDCIPADYHALAIDRMRTICPQMGYLVFSDDIGWCRHNLRSHNLEFCDNPGTGRDPLRDLILMSACRHHIISNSTYSWWGAWLNPKPDKIVIAPSQWFLGVPSSKILPKSWLTI
jgi:hypothetical protein